MMPVLLADMSNDLPLQIGLASPFVLGLGFVGKWLLQRLDDSEKKQEALYAKIIEEVVPALKSSTDFGEQALLRQEEIRQDRIAFVAKQEALLAMEKDLNQRQTELHRQEVAFLRQQRRAGG